MRTRVIIVPFQNSKEFTPQIVSIYSFLDPPPPAPIAPPSPLPPAPLPPTPPPPSEPVPELEEAKKDEEEETTNLASGGTGGEEEEEEEPLDENDPLWKATLQICKGDRDLALKMLKDPDSLLLHPKIKAIMESISDDAPLDSWESSSPIITPSSVAPSKEEPIPKKSSKSEKVEATEPEEEEVLVEGDPRQHLNLVFIGHVDAGKVWIQ